jgi:hypothetical protein
LRKGENILCEEKVAKIIASMFFALNRAAEGRNEFILNELCLQPIFWFLLVQNVPKTRERRSIKRQ